MTYISDIDKIERLKKVAEDLGFSYNDSVDRDTIADWKSFPLYKLGYKETPFVANVLKGNWNDINLIIFQHSYFTIRFPRGTDVCFTSTVALTQLPNVVFPYFYMGSYDSWLSSFDFFDKSVDFSSRPLFADRYIVRTKDKEEEEVKKIFNPQLIEYFEKKEEVLNIEAEHNKILIYNSRECYFRYSSGYSIDPLNLPKFLENTTDTIKKLTSAVKEDRSSK
jgi:hypothetical protein